MYNERDHLPDELSKNNERVNVSTAFGNITGGRATNGSVIFLEVPYALPPGRFEDPLPLPKGYQFERKEYIKETAYAVQPLNDGQAASMPFEDKVGYGKPTENPLFLNIAIPPSFPEKRGFPVRIYLHGGFLQFGSPHTLGSQAQYVSAERSEIWVNIGYRLSAFGFLASESPLLTGNYGFKDQWLALEWIKENIEAFGGDPHDIQVTGLSAGAHSVHQLLHHASMLPSGVAAPFQSAVIQSNAILTEPKTPVEHQPQFDALCRALGLDPGSSDVLQTLQDPTRIPWLSITKVVENLGVFGTFRATLAQDWVNTSPGLVEWQRSGGLARGLREHGVKCAVIGDLTEEWYLYSIAHPIDGPEDILPNMERYFPKQVAQRMIASFPPLAPHSGSVEATRRYGDIMSLGQVHLPVRIFAEEMIAHGFPVLRYQIGWSPEQHRPHGYVTHGCDRLLWTLRKPSLKTDQLEVAREWLDKINGCITEMIQSGNTPNKDPKQILALKEDRTIGWIYDSHWEDYMKHKDTFFIAAL